MYEPTGQLLAFNLSGLLVEPVGDDGSPYRRLEVIHVYHERCHRIKYTLLGPDEWRAWNTLSELLKPTHESFQRMRRDRGSYYRNRSSSASSDGSVDDSVKDHSDGEETTVDGKGKEGAKSPRSGKGGETGEKDDKAFYGTFERLEIDGGENDEGASTGKSEAVIDLD